MSKTAVLAYSGGLDTTCIIAWLKEFYDYDEVVAVLCDVGQEFDLEQSQERGYAAGADDVLLVDRREAFANDQVAKALKTNALYEGKYPLVSALSRPVIAEAVAELRSGARRRGGRPRLHRQGQRPAPLRARVPRELPGRARDRAAPRQGLDARRGDRVRAVRRASRSPSRRARRSRSTRTCSAARSRPGILEDPWEAPPEEPYLLTSDPDAAPDPVEIVIGFEGGLPVSLDGDVAPAARADRRS